MRTAVGRESLQALTKPPISRSAIVGHIAHRGADAGQNEPREHRRHRTACHRWGRRILQRQPLELSHSVAQPGGPRGNPMVLSPSSEARPRIRFFRRPRADGGQRINISRLCRAQLQRRPHGPQPFSLPSSLSSLRHVYPPGLLTPEARSDDAQNQTSGQRTLLSALQLSGVARWIEVHE